jgi:hypothetical protein
MLETMALKLRYKKKGDGSAAFTALRGDGSSTTAQLGKAGGFGPAHDLAHYVVESQFGIKKGFLGLPQAAGASRISTKASSIA